MPRHSFLILFIIGGLISCTERASVHGQAGSLYGRWVRENDQPGREPADTLIFSKNGKNILRFYLADSLAAGWPGYAETEYRLEGGKLSYRNYVGNDDAFFTVESFQWVEPQKVFSVKLYQLVRFMSADYRVTYRRIGQ